MTSPSSPTSARLVDEIAELLREGILGGRYVAGALLSQRRLAEELCVGRAVVAEALRVLEREGLVTIAPPGRGMRVAAGERSMLLSAYPLREVIDGLAARLAATHAGPTVDRILGVSVDEQREAVEADDRRGYMRANTAFHGLLIDRSGNELLRGQMTLVRSTSRSAIVLGRERLLRGIEEHETIRGAVCAREPDEAERAARAHIRATLIALEALANGNHGAGDGH